MRPARTPTRRCAVGWVGWVWARMIHPDPDAAHARMRGPTPHEISEPPPLPLAPSRSPGAAPHLWACSPMPLCPPISCRCRRASGLGTAPSPAHACAARTAARFEKSSPPSAPARHRPCTAHAPPMHRPAPPCTAPIGGRGRSTFIPRSVPSGHAVEIPCLDRGLTAPHTARTPVLAQPAPGLAD